MRAKNKMLTLLILSAGATAAIAAINKFIQISATSKDLLTEPEALCYKWRLGNVHYTKTGSGKPLLLIHDISAVSSGYEWNRLIPLLADKYTVYTIDLLGCGRSEKINMTYTNYLYVQLISDFVKNVIGHRVDVVASGESASIPVMACASTPELFDQIMLVNPLSLLDFSLIPGKMARLYKFIVETPVVGTLLYHIATSKQSIAEELMDQGFYNPYSVKSEVINSFYEAANLGNAPKSIYVSAKCNYTKCNIVNALRKINHSLYLIGGGGIECMENRLEEYKTYNSSIETAVIPKAKKLLAMEAPEALYDMINTYFT
ncbi:MAG: alpha/beta fold hydrolase [Eubacteriales bacterium]|nr:alpha/beta fold hydrolase [Eubacteriales bacterium]